MLQSLQDGYEKLISVESLFNAWELFRRGKNNRSDICRYLYRLEANIFNLHRRLSTRSYWHQPYSSFYIQDPKLRHIRKAAVSDRIVHQLLYAWLYERFDGKFIAQVYSSRNGKGTHAAIKTLRKMIYKVSCNQHLPCWALKCDIRKFYDTLDHEILIKLLARQIKDQNVLWLLRQIISSFHTEGTPGKGLPIGNLTSQIFTNIYLDPLDQFLKHRLRVRYYLRFADDFLILGNHPRQLDTIKTAIIEFLNEKLKLRLHEHKVVIRPLQQGIDFLGYVTLPYQRVIRTKTRRRMLKCLEKKFNAYFFGELDLHGFNQTLQSYLGMLKHGDCHKLGNFLRNRYSRSTEIN